MTSKSKRYCSVPQCKQYKDPNVSIHYFPRNPKLQKVWKDILKIEKPISKYMTVCSRHFLETDYKGFTGQIEFAEIILAPSGSSWHCKYECFYGHDWKILGGLESALSQVSHIAGNCDKIVFNFPIQIHFGGTNPYGWPQMVISLYKGSQLAGYARTYFPLKPGLHEWSISLLRPQTSSVLGQIASFFGYQPELLQPKMLASTDGSHMMRMEYVGELHFTLNVITQGFLGKGYKY